MQQRILASLSILVLLACNTSNLVPIAMAPTPTPTFVRAKFSTSTPTPSPTLAPTIASLEGVTPPPATTPTPEPSPTPTDEPVNEATSEEVSTASDVISLVPGEGNASDVTTVTAETDAEAGAQTGQNTIQLSESPIPTRTPTLTPSPTVPAAASTATPTSTVLPTPPPLSGRIAFPIDDGGGRYDVWVFEVPDGLPFLVAPGARQPNFSSDGQLLVNNERSERGEGIGWFDAGFNWRGIVSDAAENAYPFWSPDATRYAYSNPIALLDPITQDYLPHIFSPCSMEIPRFEESQKCKDLLTYGKVAVGEMPVWTQDDRIAYLRLVNDDGIYMVANASSPWQAQIGEPQLLVNAIGYPSDSGGFQVFFSSPNIDGNWEAYSVNLDGSNLTNLSNGVDWNDGLPTVSPDGNWVAFVSDRDERWGIWAVPRTGGEPIKLLDFNTINTNPSPWGEEDRAWTTERISWGP